MNKDLDSDSVKRGKTMKSKELLDVEESKVKRKNNFQSCVL